MVRVEIAARYADWKRGWYEKLRTVHPTDGKLNHAAIEG